jgi:hypothetical protein
MANRILVTGGAGFLGSHLCDRLLAEGYSVVVLDNLLTGSTDNIAHLAGRPDFLFVHQDGRVLHFASPGEPPVDYLELPIQTLKVGSWAPTTPWAWPRPRAPASCWPRRRGLRRPAGPPAARDYWGNVNPVGPRGVYDEAKRFAEAMTMAYHRYHGVDTRIVRIFNTYGPRMRLDDGRAVPNFMCRRCAASRSRSTATAARPLVLLRRRPGRGDLAAPTWAPSAPDVLRADPERAAPRGRPQGAPAGHLAEPVEPQHRQPGGRRSRGCPRSGLHRHPVAEAADEQRIGRVHDHNPGHPTTATSRSPPNTAAPGLSSRIRGPSSGEVGPRQRAAASQDPTSSQPASRGTTTTSFARSITA